MKDKLIECFRDTLDKINNTPLLLISTKKAIKNTKLYYSSENINYPTDTNNDTAISVIEDTSFHAAYMLTRKYNKVAVLNFASAVNPGGGVVNGAMAQEECLCRSSNLLPCLKLKTLWNDYYTYHRNLNNEMYSDRLIYTKNITVFKTDDDIPKLMPETNWFNVDVITCAAPNLRRQNGVNEYVLRGILKNRIKAILDAAVDNNIEAIILGAFGCGAFKNPPEVVAKAFREVLINEDYKRFFKEIVFAIKPSKKDNSNFTIFKKVLSVENFIADKYFDKIKIPFDIMTKEIDKNNFVEWQRNNPYYGKNISIMGDSILKANICINTVDKIHLSYGNFPIKNIDFSKNTVKYCNRIRPKYSDLNYPDNFFDENEVVLSTKQLNEFDNILKQLKFKPYSDKNELDIVGADLPKADYLLLKNGTKLEITETALLVKFFDSVCDFIEYVDQKTKEKIAPKSEKKIKYCKNCGAKVLENSKFCIKCGSNILVSKHNTLMYCPSCNEGIMHDSLFCPYCGKKIKDGESIGEDNAVFTKDETPDTYIDIRYKLIKEIGKGGSSVVYLANDEKLDRQCAVKIVSKTGYANKIASQMLLEEANKMKFLHHIAIPQLYDILDEESRLCIVMEYIEGSTLEKIIRNTRYPLAEELVVDWAKQLCRVLDYLHSLNPPRIFRDIKPSNIMLQPNGEIKLFDFGIMRIYDENKDTDTCNLGTRGFAAPEQFSTHDQSDARTDIYALGITIHYLLTGINPVKMEKEILPISTYRPELPTELDYIIVKCTQRNPDDRYQNCKEVLYDLENYNKNKTKNDL